MGLSIKQNTVVAVKKETTEGTYEAPTAGSDFITALEDGLEINGAKESLERNILGVGLTKPQPRTANRSVTGTVPCEMKASSNPGDAPEFGDLVEAAMGATRQNTTNVTSGTGHSTTVINIEDADISKFNVGDIIVVNEAGDFHTSPITAVDPSIGAANITLLVAADSAFSDNVVIAKFTTYYTADTGHPTFSITKWIENQIKTEGVGCRVTSMAVENFTANQLANISFGFEGLDFDTKVEANGLTPSYDSSLPPIIVEACLYKDGVQLPVSDFSVTIENTIGTATSTCSPSGKISSRISERTITGTITPYVENDDVDIQTDFDNDTLFSLFISAHNPTTTDGEYNQVVAFYLPNCSITELTESDLDGILTHSITYSASGGTDGSETQMFVSFI